MSPQHVADFQVTIRVWVCFWKLCSLSLAHLSFLPSCTVWTPGFIMIPWWWRKSSNFVLLFVLAILGPSALHVNIRLSLLISIQILLGFWLRLYWLYQFGKNWHLHNILSMNMVHPGVYLGGLSCISVMFAVVPGCVEIICIFHGYFLVSA